MEAWQDEFTRLYESCADRVMVYCLRHVDPGAAEDVVSETFTVAWRRFADLPAEPLPWLYTTAWNLIRNRYRSRAGRRALTHRLAALTQLTAEAAEVTATRRNEIVQTLGALSEQDREALLLTAWDGLTSTEAADVLGCSAGALRVRIHRARKQLAALSEPESRSNHV